MDPPRKEEALAILCKPGDGKPMEPRHEGKNNGNYPQTAFQSFICRICWQSQRWFFIASGFRWVLRKNKSSSFSNQELHYTWIDQTNSMPICRDWMPWWWYAEWQLYFSCLICFRWLPEQVGWRDCGNSTCHQWWTSGSCFGPRLGTLSRHVGYARAADGGNDFGKFFGTCFAVLNKNLISISKDQLK